MAAFSVHALAARQPLIDLRLLRTRSYAAATSVLFLSGLALYGPLLLLALWYQQVQGQSAFATGLLLAPQGIGSLLPRAVVGRLTDRLGARPVALAGLALTALGTLAFTRAGPGTGEWLLGGSLLVRGAGLAAATIAVMAGAFAGLPRSAVADASSTTRIVQQVGGAFGTAGLTVILARAGTFGVAFWWAIGVTLFALLPALLLAGKQTGVRPVLQR